jgi:hypothetical protein
MAYGFILLLVVLAGVKKCHAADMLLTLSAWSYHLDRSKHYNERNYGLGLQYQTTDTTRAVVGCYRNSFYDRSCYAGMLWRPSALSFDRLHLGLMGGVVTGYQRTLIGALPVATFDVTKRVELSLTGCPGVNGSPGLITGAVGVRF